MNLNHNLYKIILAHYRTQIILRALRQLIRISRLTMQNSSKIVTCLMKKHAVSLWHTDGNTFHAFNMRLCVTTQQIHKAKKDKLNMTMVKSRWSNMNPKHAARNSSASQH